MFDYDLIVNQSESISKLILKGMYPNSTFKDPVREEKSIKDIIWMLTFIVEAKKVDNKKIVENFILWLRRLFISLSIDELHAELLFKVTKAVLNQEFHNDDLNQFLDSIDFKIVEVEKIASELPYHVEMKKYLNALLDSNRNGALQIVNEMLGQGVSVEDIYLYVFQESMREIGELWHDGIISVGMEHYCTAVTQFIMSTMYERIFTSKRVNKKLLSCAVGSELHEMGIRMVTDVFEMHGWDTFYLGANLPIEEIVKFTHIHKPDIIALGITMPYHLSFLKSTIEMIRKVRAFRDIKIIVGGVPFLDNEELYLALGADGFAKNAAESVKVASELLQ